MADPASQPAAGASPEVLPSSIARSKPGQKWAKGALWDQLFCASCGKPGGMVMEQHKDFAFYLCDPCAERYGNIPGHVMVPDEVFFARVKQAQIEEHGRELSVPEILVALDDPGSSLSKLAKDRYNLPEYQHR